MPAYLGIFIAILGGALAQLLIKSGLRSVSFSDIESVIFGIKTQPIGILLIITGIGCYVLAMVVWVHTLQNHELSKAFPLLSLGYVVVYLAAAFWPGVEEAYTLRKSLGIALIVFGVWYSQRSSKPHSL